MVEEERFISVNKDGASVAMSAAHVGIESLSGMILYCQRVNTIFILPRTTNYGPIVWVRLVAFTKLRHPPRGTRQIKENYITFNVAE